MCIMQGGTGETRDTSRDGCSRGGREDGWARRWQSLSSILWQCPGGCAGGGEGTLTLRGHQERQGGIGVVVPNREETLHFVHSGSSPGPGSGLPGFLPGGVRTLAGTAQAGVWAREPGVESRNQATDHAQNSQMGQLSWIRWKGAAERLGGHSVWKKETRGYRSVTSKTNPGHAPAEGAGV